MSYSIYQASIPGFIRTLGTLSTILEKAAAYATEKKIDETVLTGSRLAANMFPLTRQVQIATDGVKGYAARMSGVEVPSYEDTETTFAELQARIAKTVAFLKSIDAKTFDAAESKQITLKVGGNELSFVGQDYLSNFVVPNFYFHVTTTYAILRHNGVDIGKMDYLGQLSTAA